jgi:hypothetical protein
MISWRPENVVRQLPWRLDSKAAVGFLLILATFSLVAWLYLTQASAVTATRYRIDEFRVELDQLRNQNAALALEIAQLEKLARVETRAQELGLGPTTNIRYLPVANYPLSSTNIKDPLLIPESLVSQERNVATLQYPNDTMASTSDWGMDILDDFLAWFAEE